MKKSVFVGALTAAVLAGGAASAATLDDVKARGKLNCGVTTGLVGFGAPDANGNWQFTLNGEKIFHWGPLDQGWWPGSFLNPPADEAIVWEMEYLK